jgi:hypothetical protein
MIGRLMVNLHAMIIISLGVLGIEIPGIGP